MDLYLLSYNNYYNRIVKKSDTLDGYADYLLDTVEDYSFNPNDGISAEIVINYEPLNGVMPDYLVVADEQDEIHSRWWVIECVRVRASQYRVILYRDVIADWKERIISTPVFIEKAMLPTASDLIFNNENMTFNQIKTSETLLKDATGASWIVGYVPRNFTGGTYQLLKDPSIISQSYPDLESYPYYQYVNSRFKGEYANPIFTLNINISKNDTDSEYGTGSYIWTADKGMAVWGGSYGYKTTAFGTRLGYRYTAPDQSTFFRYASTFNSRLRNSNLNFDINLSSYVNSNNPSALIAENGKIIQAGDKYYKVTVWYEGLSPITNAAVPIASDLGSKMRDAGKLISEIISINEPGQIPFQIYYANKMYKISLDEITLETIDVTIPNPANRLHLEDAPYDMFCMPYSQVAIDYYDSEAETSSIIPFYDDYLQFAMMLSEKIGEDNLLDLQLLPYCPLPKAAIYGRGLIRPQEAYSTGNLPKFVNYLTTATSVVGAMFWCSTSSFTTDIVGANIDIPTDPVEFKIMNETTFFRLCSPNYNGVFEIAPTRNRGFEGLTASCSYKPYTPYIKVSPEFNGLYGNTYNDARGLILGGDFSLPQITNQWKTYQIQNKNYQTMFNREIESMEINNQVSRIREYANMAAGVVSAGVTGGMAGGMAGGVHGAAAGIAGGALLSLGGGIADIELNEKLRTEALDLKRDMFGYQLGNIRALPHSLTKVSAFNINNKIFPFIEEYTASDEEKTALRNKIIYNGMTVMTIGQIENFIQATPSYIKGRLIRITDLGDDFHTAKVIADELYKGVYI